MEKQTVQQTMQQGSEPQNTENYAVQQEASQEEKTRQDVAYQEKKQAAAKQEKQQSAVQQSRSQKTGGQRAAQQKRAAKRRRNNVIKALLIAVLAVQIICAVELFMVLKKADSIIDKLDGEALNYGAAQEQEDNASQNDGTEREKAEVGDSSIIVSGGSLSDSGNSSEIQSDSGEEETQAEQVISDEDAWKLVLVNKWNTVEEGYVPELAEYAEGHMVDARIEDSLRDMIKGAKKAGYAIYLLSAYRDVDKQTDLYEAEVAKWKAAGYTQAAAEEKAGTVVAVPGTSEHHLGLAVDLVSSEHVKLDEGAEKTQGYKWLVAHCHEYGFILRYPNGATEITGIIYEPWHFRYVGVEAATEIMEAGITLEEYLEQLGV